jgi:preprotein translocase subunit SecG
MLSGSLLAAGLIMSILAVLFAICCVVLILVILIQKGKGGGLSSAFAGGMASGLLGSKTGDVLTWVTISVVGIFLFAALVLDKWWKPTMSRAEQNPAPITSTERGTRPGRPAPAAPEQQAPAAPAQPQQEKPSAPAQQ